MILSPIVIAHQNIQGKSESLSEKERKRIIIQSRRREKREKYEEKKGKAAVIAKEMKMEKEIKKSNTEIKRELQTERKSV